jgi:hypothetical protein
MDNVETTMEEKLAWPLEEKLAYLRRISSPHAYTYAFERPERVEAEGEMPAESKEYFCNLVIKGMLAENEDKIYMPSQLAIDTRYFEKLHGL